MRRLLLLGTLALAFASPHAVAARSHPAAPSPAPIATPGPENPVVTKLVRREFLAWQLGTPDRSHYAPKFAALMTSAKVRLTGKELATLGALDKVVWLGKAIDEQLAPDLPVYVYELRCTLGVAYVELALAKSGKIKGLIYRDSLPIFSAKP